MHDSIQFEISENVNITEQFLYILDVSMIRLLTLG